ncbi:MAG: glycoside hydrolase family 18 protein [Clostridia bacterium]|nr:glycoside hydrolase family 18 protein [Clostridia bacterium]
MSILSGFLGLGGIKEQKAETFRVTTYVVADYVQDINTLHSEDFDIITDVILFGAATFDNKGNVYVNDESLSKALQNLRTVIGDRDIHMTLNILGPGGHTDSTVWEDQMEAQSDEHNKAFASGVLEDNIIAVLDKYDLDGVHFDYEHPLSNKAWNKFNRFLVSIGKKLGERSVGVSLCEWNLKLSTQALRYVDTVEVMLYDIFDAEGRHATTETMKENAKQIGLSGIPYEKVNIGLPFYSRPTDRGAYWYSYNGYADVLDENGYYTDENIGKTFWFNTPDVIAEKTDFAIKGGYGGVMIWHYTCDFPSSNEASLLGSIGEVIVENY